MATGRAVRNGNIAGSAGPGRSRFVEGDPTFADGSSNGRASPGA